MTVVVGVIGLGQMGSAIASRLSAAGYSMVGYDIREDLLEGLSQSVDILSSVKAVPVAADVVITVLPGPGELQQVMGGEDGVLHAMRPGTLWLDMTSSDPPTASALASEAARCDVDVVGAPMGGSPPDAASGTLRFFLGGTPEAINRAIPLLTRLSSPDGLTVVGNRVIDGYLAKLLANTLWFGQAVAVTEALLIGAAAGLSPDVLGPVLQDSAGGSAFLTNHLPRLLNGDNMTEFGIDRVVEELDAIVALATQTGTPAPVTTLVAALHTNALHEYGPIGGELLAARLLERRAGRNLHTGNNAGSTPAILDEVE